MQFIDSHCHLNLYEKQNVNEIINNAKLNGITNLLTVCTNQSDFNELNEIITNYDNVYRSIGIHPHHAHEITNKPELKKLLLHELKKPKTIAVGEIGLDFADPDSLKEIQEEIFIEQINIALEEKLPVIIHMRNSEKETINILKKYRNLKGVIHCFSGSLEFAHEVLDLGFYISFSGIITFKNAELIRKAAFITPIEKILIETDAPFLAPVPNRGKKNEPAFLIFIAEKIAEIKNISIKEIAEITTKNFFTLFNRAAFL